MSAPLTKEESWWAGPGGAAYARAFLLEPGETDAFWALKYGARRSALARLALGDLARDAPVLEVGCSCGNQMALLRAMGFEDLCGVDINGAAVAMCRDRGLNAQAASATALPFADGAFELAFTCGVLSHLGPAELPAALAELARVSRRLVWLTEYRADPHADGRWLWARDHAAAFLEHAPGSWMLAKSWTLAARPAVADLPTEFHGLLELGSVLECAVLERRG